VFVTLYLSIILIIESIDQKTTKYRKRVFLIITRIVLIYRFVYNSRFICKFIYNSRFVYSSKLIYNSRFIYSSSTSPFFSSRIDNLIDKNY